MPTVSLVLTALGADRPGVVEQLSRVVASCDATWTESRMSHLAGQFAGVALVEVPPENVDQLVERLAALEAAGISVTAQRSEAGPAVPAHRVVQLELLGTDRPGILSQISAVLAAHRVNVEELVTHTYSAPMAGSPLFEATIQLNVPAELRFSELRERLEAIANDLMVDIILMPPRAS